MYNSAADPRQATLALHAMEQAVIAGRPPYTVFRYASQWTWVRHSGRLGDIVSTPKEAADDARAERDTLDWLGQEPPLITLEP